MGRIVWLFFAWSIGVAASTAADPAPLFTDAARIRRLPRELAAKALPVRLQGVVTWRAAHPATGFTMRSGDEAIYVSLDLAAQDGRKPEPEDARALEPGVILAVEGTTHPGEFAPLVVARRLTRLGTGPLPPARAVELVDLLDGRLDSQRVEIAGVVQAVKVTASSGMAVLEIAERAGKFRGVITGPAILDVAQLVDARVRLRGSALTLFNSHGEIVGVSIQTNLADDVRMTTPPPGAVFAGPLLSLAKLRPFSPDGPPLHRLHVAGIVTASAPGDSFFLQEGERAVQVFSATKAAVAPGAVLEVAGFAGTRGAASCLENAVFRQTGKVTPPAAVAVTVGQALGHAARRLTAIPDFNGRLVRLRGKLLSLEAGGNDLRAVLESDGHVLDAYLGSPAAPVPARLQPGCLVEATGVASIAFGSRLPALDYPRPAGLSLVLRSFDDLAVLAAPPWWNTRRLAWFAALAGGLALALLTWNWTLRARVARQGHELFHQKRALRDTELERETAQRERDRIAGELHDGLQQWLSTVSLHVNAASSRALASQPEAAAHLLTAQRGLLRTQEELRRSVWGLREAVAGGASFREALERAMQVFADWRGAALRIEESGAPLRLPAHVAASLVLVAQEAVGNALRHGEAHLVRIETRWSGEGLTLVIADDGGGFDPAQSDHLEGHFGLTGMRARLRRIGGHLAIASAPGEGARLTATIPREALEAEGAG